MRPARREDPVIFGFSPHLTYMSMAGYANRTNFWTESVAAQLNHKFGSCRIMHGSEAQWSGGLANRNDDSVVVFHPSGEIYIYENLQEDSADPARNGDLVLHDILKRYFPNRSVWQ